MAWVGASQEISLWLRETSLASNSALKMILNIRKCRRFHMLLLWKSYVCSGLYASESHVHCWHVRWVMRYLQRTKDSALVYRKSDQLDIIGYSNSNFTRCQDSRRSTSGYVYLLAGGAISWKSVKQTLIASSTMAAKYIVWYEASNQGIWLRNFVMSL